MLRSHLPKMLICCAITLWAAFTLLPVKDRDFAPFVREEASAKAAEFGQLIDQAAERARAKQAPSVFVALKQLGQERQIDLAQYFPQIRLEATLRNIEKRNALVLDELLRLSKGRLQLGLDLKGGVAFTLEADAQAVSDLPAEARTEKLAKAIEIIGDRVNGLGVAEPLIRAVGDNRIEVQLPGVSTAENPDVVKTLQKPAQLAFRLVMANTSALSERPPGEAPAGYEYLATEDEDHRTGATLTRYYVVKRIPEMGGEGVKDAFVRVDEFGRYQIHLSFNSDGARQFADVTTANVHRQLGVVLDGRLYSAPNINEPITGGSAQITGNFTQREAFELANVLNNPLDVPLQIKEMYEVGPSLAVDAISRGVSASVLGTVLVCAFMITYYTVGGVVAILTLAVNILVILGVMASIPATLTLPGLAGIVLTIGMAVDANILIFERMREELALGKSLQAAHTAGYEKAFITIFDAHFTQLLICGVMIALGTGPIKGFGVTLAIGVFSTLFSVLLVGQLILDLLIEGGVVRRFPMFHLFKKVEIDWIRYGKPAFVVSWSIVVLGLGFLLLRHDKALGIDFTGGDQVTLAYERQVDIAQLRAAATAAGLTDISPSYQSPLGGSQAQLKIELPYGATDRLVAAFQAKFPEAKFANVGVAQIGPTIGAEIGKNAALSLGLSFLAILAYIAFRFEFGFGIGAVVATLHDVLMTVGMFVVFGGQFNAPMVAAILAIIGYSVNDTVVVFDRIREELKLNPDGDLRTLVNLAISRVFSRSVMTSLTTFLAAIALFLVGGGVLRDLALTFLIGIITGTFSSIFIAAQVFYWWHKGDRKHVEAHSDIAPKYEWAGSSRASQ